MEQKMVDAINDQINFELYSGYIYYSMGTYLADLGLPGMTQWMIAQTQEEMFHAHKMLMFVAERGERVLLKAIEGPATSWDSPLAAFENALEHEKIVTGRINNMADLAQGLGDDAARDFLQWYIDEQEEEEETVGGVADKVRLAGDSDDALFMLDKELGARVFMMPAAESE